MKAQSKNEFLNNWDDYTNQFILLANSTSKQDIWEQIRRLQKEMTELIEQVADECYDKES